MNETKKESYGALWASRIKVLLISGVLASIANMIYEWRTHAATIHMPWEVFPALLYMFIIIVVSCLIHDLVAKLLPVKVPVILYVALMNLGSITGGMTSTPALGTLISVAGTEDVAAAYAATYPIALISVVLVSQFLVILF